MKRLSIHLFAFLMLLGTVLPSAMAATASEPTPASVPASSEPDSNAVKAALKDFRSLPRSERKSRLKEARKMFKQYKADKKAGKKAETDTVLLCILAILLPPLAVYLHQEEINSKFWISLLLTLIFWLPGVVYAFLVIFGEA